MAVDALRSSPVAPLGCKTGDRYTSQTIRKLLQPLYDVPVLRLSSVYFLKIDFLGLQARNP